MRPISSIIWFCFMSMYLVSCRQVLPGSEAVPPPTEVLPDTPTATATSPGSGRYINEEGGFSLILPATWDIIGPLEAATDQGSTFSLYLLGENPAQGSGPGLSKIVIAAQEYPTVEQYLEYQCSTCPSHPTEMVTLGDAVAVHTLSGGGAVPHLLDWYFIEGDSSWIGLCIHDPETLEPLHEVLDSFRFE
jgi:hypothetical protein